MSRRQKDPLRALTAEEQQWLQRSSRAHSEPASHGLRAKLLLAVAGGASFSEAARAVGRRSNAAVAQLVTRFNQAGIAAITPGHGGGQPVTYGRAERQQILDMARRMPDRDADGTATWSLHTLQRALRTAPAGLPTVSTATLRSVLLEAGWTWQRTRSWCETGSVVRRRKAGPTTVVDPDTAAKKR